MPRCLVYFQFPERCVPKDYLKPVLGILNTFFHRKHSVFRKHLPRPVLGQHCSDAGASRVRGAPALRVVHGPVRETPVNSHDTVLRGGFETPVGAKENWGGFSEGTFWSLRLRQSCSVPTQKWAPSE